MIPRVVEEASLVRVSITGPLRHQCPHVDEADVGEIDLSWNCDGGTLELHSLAEYLASWADVAISHEALTAQILADLVGLDAIEFVRVTTRWRTAGLDVEVSIIGP